MDGWRSDPGGLTGLRGRRSECAVLDGVIAALSDGESRTLVIRGEAGIGKTALLGYLVGAASGLTVLRAVGVESEMELAFASLHQVCAPMLDRLERLPAPQRNALEIVFGLSEGPAPDRFLVGLAVLNLLAEVAEERPVLCIVDDAQWLDRASAQTLAFVARRLLAERVGLVFGTRVVGEDLRGLPELELQGLRNGDARALLSSVVRFVLDERVRDRIVTETRGNPLALLELPRGLTATQLAGGFGLAGAQELSGRIEASFLRRLHTLPDDTRLLLLVAAAEPVGDPQLLRRAAERLGIAAAAAIGTDTDGLLILGEQVTFRHPLVRSAVYGSAQPEQRRAVHVALAEVTDRERDPDRRAWHLAAAATGPDEAVASELERSAGRAQARGGLAAAAVFLQRSVALTLDANRRSDRALAAAEASLQAGAFEAALGLLATAEAGALGKLQRARIELLRAQIAFASRMGPDAPLVLLRAAQRLEPLNAEIARETYLDAWGAASFAGHLAADGLLHEVSRAARSAPKPDGAPGPSDLLLDALATMITEGLAAATPLLSRVSGTFANQCFPAGDSLRWGWLASVPSWVQWDEESVHAINAHQLRAARDAGALARLPMDLSVFSMLVTWRGEFASAEEAIAEADAITQATGTRIAPYGATLLAAFRGREAEASPLIESMIKLATAGGQGAGVRWAQWVTAVLFNGLGHYERAFANARRASEDPPGVIPSDWALPELIEAATRSEKPDLGAAVVDRLSEIAAAARTDWALGVEARSRALLRRGSAAEELYREAIERLAQTPLRTELARGYLVYGEWLRREHRRVDARAALRAAYEMFGAIGMEAFGERARRELLATGENVRRRVVETREELTPQETQIAWLARDGVSNAEIGARLFISRRTVEHHLSKVFTKLGVKSRHGLDQALPREPTTTIAS